MESKKRERDPSESSQSDQRSKKDKVKKKKKSKDKKKQEKLLKAAKKYLQMNTNFPNISEDDYFLKNEEFRFWLNHSQGKNFSDLTGEESRKKFSKFVAQWNAGKLPDMFYNGLPQQAKDMTHRTSHKWKFVSKLSEGDKLQLDSIRDGIGYQEKKAVPLFSEPAPSHASTLQTSDPLTREDEREKRKWEEKRLHKRLKMHNEAVLEELVPKETGREAMIEKRKQKSERIHGPARVREDDYDFNDSTLMGSTDSDFKKALQKRKDIRERKESAKALRASELQQKEEQRMNNFIQAIGFTPGQKITIKPRE